MYILDNNNNNNNNEQQQTTSVYSSISSSSSTTSSSATTTDDDLLVQELESMWKLKSINTTNNQQQEQIKLDINSDEMLMQLLISHAVIDAREFKVLTFEEFETLKQVMC
jgi:fructose-1,6-bisphosphatase